MKERSFVADAREARGLHDGSITRVVRVVEPQPEASKRHPWARSQFAGVDDKGDGVWQLEAAPVPRNQFGGMNIHTSRCLISPYGVPEDRLWVGEEWYYDMLTPDLECQPANYDPLAMYYRADGECCEQIPECCCGEVGPTPWRTAEQMPRWASRTLLNVTDVRVIQVQEITEEDAKALGLICTTRFGSTAFGIVGWTMERFLNDYTCVLRQLFCKTVWDANVYMWLGTMEKVDHETT